MHPFVHVDHEGMEMDAPLALDVRWDGLVEEVHEHGLARPDVAVEVQALRSVLRGRGAMFDVFCTPEPAGELGRVSRRRLWA